MSFKHFVESEQMFMYTLNDFRCAAFSIHINKDTWASSSGSESSVEKMV